MAESIEEVPAASVDNIIEAEEFDGPPSYTPLEDATQALNILIVGESQQGKSTLIKQLNRYAKQPDIAIGIGHGNVACTKIVGQYNIPATIARYQLVNPDETPIGELPYEELCDLDRSEAQVVEVPAEEAHETFNFSFIDTPGLDDSDGEDIEIMAAIIGRLGELSHINAVVYVRNINKPFSNSFKQFFDYIQRSLPSLSAGLIIVHTCFTIKKVAEFLDDSKNLAALRQDAFKAATNLELVHFFMDNEPSKYKPFAVMESLNSCYRLLNHLSSQRPIAVTGLQLLKTDQMKSYEGQVVTSLVELKYNLQQEWSRANATKSAKDQEIFNTQFEVAKQKKKLDKCRDRASQLENGPDVVLGSKAAAEEYSWVINLLLLQEVNVGSKRVDYIAECAISTVAKTTNDGSKWMDENLQGSSWSAIITASAFRDLGGTATFYAKSKDKHRSELKELKDRCADYEEQIQYLEQSLKGSVGTDAELVAIGDRIERVGGMIETLKMDKFDIELYKDLRRFYASRHRASLDEIREFVQVYDEAVARIMK